MEHDDFLNAFEEYAWEKFRETGRVSDALVWLEEREFSQNLDKYIDEGRDL